MVVYVELEILKIVITLDNEWAAMKDMNMTKAAKGLLMTY